VKVLVFALEKQFAGMHVGLILSVSKHIQCPKKLFKCFVLLQCVSYNSRTTRGKVTHLGLFESPTSQLCNNIPCTAIA
jgi:hypothetical protein